MDELIDRAPVGMPLDEDLSPVSVLGLSFKNDPAFPGLPPYAMGAKAFSGNIYPPMPEMKTVEMRSIEI